MTKTSWKVRVILFRCEMTKTQLDPRSSIRACLCTEDFCNHDEQGGELFGEILYSCTTLSPFENMQHFPTATPSTPESGVQCSEVLVQVIPENLKSIFIFSSLLFSSVTQDF